MERTATATARKALLPLAILLPLAGCAMSPGAWAYYDRRYDNGWEGYDRPVTYSGAYSGASAGSSFGDAASGRPYRDASSTLQPRYPEWAYNELPDYAAELNAAPRSSHRCNCIQARPAGGKDSSKAAAHDPSWNSTYYSIGP